MRQTFVLFVLALAAVQGVNTLDTPKFSTAWRNCGTNTDFLKIEHVKAFPHGRFVTLAVIGDLDHYIGAGQITVTQVKDDMILDESHFCMCCKEMDICPIKKGKLTFSRNLLVSPFVEEGSMTTFQVRVDVDTTLTSLRSDAEPTFYNGKFKPLMFCVEIDVPVVNQHSPLDYIAPSA